MKGNAPAAGRPPAPTRLAATRARVERAGVWAREHVPWADMVAEALERERLAAAGLLAGGLAYRLFFWTVPLGLVLAAVLGFWVETDRTALESAARDFGLGGAAASAAADAIERDAHSRWYFLGVGLALLFWFAAGVARAVHVAFSVAWRLRPGKLEHSFRAGLVFTGLMFGVLAVSTGAAALREAAPGPGLTVTLLLVFVYCVVTAWIMQLLPSRASGWSAFLPGAIYIAVGTQLIQLLVVFYLAPKLGRSSELYGTLGAATVVLLWLYLEARLVVGGAFLNAALWERRQPAPSGEEPG